MAQQSTYLGDLGAFFPKKFYHFKHPEITSGVLSDQKCTPRMEFVTCNKIFPPNENFHRVTGKGYTE